MEKLKVLSMNGLKSKGSISIQTMGRGLKIYESAFPKSKLTKETLSIWTTLLSDLTEEQFVRGVTTFCRDHKEIYPGTNVIAHIREYGINEVKVDAVSDALIAFQELWTTRNTSNSMAQKAYLLIGDDYGQCMTDDKAWHEKRFVQVYKGLAENKDNECHEEIPMLSGMAQIKTLA